MIFNIGVDSILVIKLIFTFTIAWAEVFYVYSRFLWRKNSTFAISRHYKRFDVFIEAEANKAAAKYDNVSIDFQMEFYRKEGLTPYSVAKLPITSGKSIVSFCIAAFSDIEN